MAKKKSLIDKVEEMAKEKEIEQETNKNYKVSGKGGYLMVKDKRGNVIGSIKKSEIVTGKIDGDNLEFNYGGTNGYISQNYVEEC